MVVDPNSVNFQFGQILQRLEAGEAREKSIDDTSKAHHSLLIKMGDTMARMQERMVVKEDIEAYQESIDTVVETLPCVEGTVPGDKRICRYEQSVKEEKKVKRDWDFEIRRMAMGAVISVGLLIVGALVGVLFQRG